ncbi:hypothetical protein J31TS4_45260 [Paenibacillus sp. J31TS4]|uniref:DEAD/DEAH box helicase n=1 Tax=Paenibacillus sp. J31TS4 TaxID=2807195 RepID=UPI001B0AAE9C|nr:DEAD/DEAH box helicase [Paenibacillus sp. J31TS4]GIP41246.1 hypothetical protein J31TS4_45260 [Paenibacillus sp. J31TS4]
MQPTFDTLPIGEAWLSRLQALGIHEPTPVQAEAIPLLHANKDVIVQSQTGTGKTLAYLLPLLDRIDPAEKKVQAVVLVPTRELGMQIVDVAGKLTEGTSILAQPLIGGASVARQLEKLKLHPQLVVGTPGRIAELLKTRKLTMHHVRTIVLDEADQVFQLSSVKEVETILSGALRDRQLAFFSATIPDELIGVADRWMNEPVRLTAGPPEAAPAKVEHLYLVCEDRDRIDTLRRAIRTLQPKKAIIFITDTEVAAEVEGKLRYSGLRIGSLYGDADKLARSKVIRQFREGRLPLLLATDVAARGLDFPDITHVFHFEPAADADHYLHRSGRTGRMGRSGTVVSLVTEKERFILDKFAKRLGISFERKRLYGGELTGPGERRGRAAEEPRSGRAEAGAPSEPGRPAERAGRGSAPQKPAGARPPSGAGLTREDAAGGPSAERAAERRAPLGGAAAGKPARSGAERAGEPSARTSAAGPAPGKAKAEFKEARHRDRKNKGAPKWLKEKRDREN